MISFRHPLSNPLSILIFLIFIICSSHAKAQMLEQSFDLAVKHIVDAENYSDSVKLRTKYWTTLNLDHRFFILDSAEFSNNQLLTLNTNYHKYMEHPMTLKFYADKKLRIKYEPTLVKKALLYDDRGYFEILSEGRDYKEVLGEEYSLREKNEEFFITKPYLVKHVWKTIPEPHRLITDRKHLRKRSAKEGIAVLLNEKVDSPGKLDKRVKKKGPWVLSGVENVQLSQAYLENWTKGGENSIALQSDLLLKANYKKDKVEWENYARHKVGIISSESYATQINTDQIVLNSKYGIKASKQWYYSGLFDFKTQFFNGYNNKDRENIISGFMSPAYFTFALGMDYKKDKNFTLLLSPFTSKITYVMDTVKVDKGRYIDEKDKKASYNTGLSMVSNINWKISTELNLKSKLEAFKGYFSSSDVEQIDWELIFDMRINRFLSTRINTQLRYFNKESDKIQFRESFAVNFSYKF